MALTKHIRGERHYRAKLSDAQVREMRKVWHAWEKAGDQRGYKSLGDLFGAPWPTVRDIVTYRTRVKA